MTNSTTYTDQQIQKEAHWIVAIENSDRRIALRSCSHRSVNAATPELAQFWQDVADHINEHNLGWFLQ